MNKKELFLDSLETRRRGVVRNFAKSEREDNVRNLKFNGDPKNNCSFFPLVKTSTVTNRYSRG